jgi:hypothetical protein
VIAVIPSIGNERSIFVWVSSSQIPQRIVNCSARNVCSTIIQVGASYSLALFWELRQWQALPIHAPESVSFPSVLLYFSRKQKTEENDYVYMHVSSQKSCHDDISKAEGELIDRKRVGSHPRVKNTTSYR